MADPQTPFLGLIKPIVNDEAGEDLWGEKLNGNADILDASVSDMAGDIATLQGTALTDSPHDGKTYGRKDALWVDVSTSVAIDWANVTGKPSTFPPTLPIPSSGVTGLDTAQAAQDTAINGKVAKLGDTMTGPLTLSGDPGVPLHAATKAYVDAQVGGAAGNAYTKAQADARFEPIIVAGTTAQYWRGNKTWATLDKAAVGLSNVDNTADANKPVSTAQAAADALKQDLSAKGAANGYAPLDGTSKVPLANLPPIPAAGTYVPETGPTGAGNLPAGTTAQRPANAAGLIRFNSDLGAFEGNNGSAWSGIGGGAKISDTPPSTPQHGDLWWESDTGQLWIRFDDGTSQQWVAASPGTDLATLDTRYLQQANGIPGVYKVSSGSLGSAVANLDITLPAGYPGGFELLLNNFGMVTDAQALTMRFSADGTTFLAANYNWALNTVTALASATNTPSGSSTSTFLALMNAMGNTAGTRYGGKVNIPAVLAGAVVPSVFFQGHCYSGSAYVSITGAGTISAGITGTPAAIRLLSTSGNLAAGGSWQLNGFK